MDEDAPPLSLDWSLFERDSAAHWVALRRERGVGAVFELSDALVRHVRSVRPDWPSDAERAADLKNHVELCRVLGRSAKT